MKTCCKA